MKLVNLKKAHEGKFLTYYVADYLNKENKIKSYEFISRNKNLTLDDFGNSEAVGVGVIPISLDNSKILLQREFRLACNQWVYNFTAGLIDPQETPEIAAKRELFEETGVELVKIDAVLAPSYASAPTSDELMVIIIGRAEGEIKESIFVDEEISAKWYTKEEIKELLDSGALMSVRTQIFLYKWVNE